MIEQLDDEARRMREEIQTCIHDRLRETPSMLRMCESCGREHQPCIKLDEPDRTEWVCVDCCEDRGIHLEEPE